MKALAELPAGQGVAAMQRINVVVLNPLFLGVFMGTALLSFCSVVVAALSGSSPRSLLLLASRLFYLLGSFVVTIAFNVPRNDRLARLGPESLEAASYWPTYVREWTRWNHVRSVASTVSAACAAGALAT
jgi:uncharacterized membrane protein